MAKVIESVLTFEEREFVNDKGERIQFTACTALINNEEIRLSIKKEDKSLLRAVLRGVPEVNR